ncbi:MAG: GtrA family protein [Pseudomonadota bacterium]
MQTIDNATDKACTTVSGAGASHDRFARFGGFTLFSGIGWLLDTGVMLLLVHLGLGVTPANLIGASVGVGFVYVTAQRVVFRRHGREFSRLRCIAAYAAYQIVAIAASSVLIGALADLLVLALPQVDPTILAGCAKIIVTPLTMCANFTFMAWLLKV